ncbi:DUF4097 family beta strand repeat protein [Streptomyces oryzae]|uniref:DUF4097 family beta strand repeat protein n=1 Tax=Streptomyces oryzae TaxID=1434886 RepID=A0ABS3XI49_9ACTN|nr:DUF4097 family beta strand repeat-containing protein [Streptomyces oryzae]MBO8194986.1 DUF4097 family beta strand repeat protein [Streptomyces oryzae]
MPAPEDRSWQITEPRRIEFDDPVTELDVRVVNGTVNVVGTADTTTRVEIGEVKGPPLEVKHQDGRLVVAYEDLPWRGFLKWLDRKGWRREVEVSVRVPAAVALSVGVVGASAVVSGVRGRARVAGVSGGTTLVGLTGPVHAETVSGDVETQRLSGSLHFSTVSGDLTCIDASASKIKADSVSGAMILDLRSPRAGERANIRLSSVSGELALRLPEDADLTVHASTAGGAVSSAFDELSTGGDWGAHQVTGILGKGRGALHAVNVSGGVAVLRRPPDDDPADDLGRGDDVGPWDDVDDLPDAGDGSPSTADPDGPARDAAPTSGPHPPEPPGNLGNPSPAKDL